MAAPNEPAMLLIRALQLREKELERELMHLTRQHELSLADFLVGYARARLGDPPTEAYDAPLWGDDEVPF